MNYAVKSPESDREFQAMWELNHAVFSAELHQHPLEPAGMLIDKFDGKNVYRIAWDGVRALGMISAHWQPPFSAAERFGDVIAREIEPGHTAEIRLFALRPESRSTLLASRLAGSLFHLLRERDMTKLIISGISTRRRFYEHVGFRAVGEPVTDGNAAFYPMCGRLEQLLGRCDAAIGRSERN